MKTIKKGFSFFLVLCLMLSASISVLAASWDLSDGDISISFVDSKQTVTQNATSQEDANPTITSTGETANTVTVSSGAGETAQFTVENLNINTEKQNSAIDITAGTSAVMTVEGSNAVDNTALGSGDTHAAIHVGNGASLTIQGGSGSDNELLVNENHLKYDADGSGAAGIGSNKGEDFNGELTITGDVYVGAQATNYGAAIGSGSGSDFTGTLNIENGAEVHVEGSDRGTGLGAGNKGDFTGAVNITDSTVYADTYSNGAGIGAGFQGDFTGEVSIDGSDVTAISGPSGSGEGAGIGAGGYGDFSGTVSITDSTVLAKATNDGAGIGAGGTDSNAPGATEFSGQVNIHNSNVTADTRSQGIPIGAPESIADRSYYDGVFSGTVNVTGDSELTLIDGRNTTLGQQALIGGASEASNGQVNIQEGVKVTYWAGNSEDKGDIDDGSFATAAPDDYPELIKGAVVTVTEALKPNDGPSGSGGTGDTGSSGGTAAPDTFWNDLLKQIMAADKGDKLVANAGQRTSMPTYILKALTEYEVQLTIQWNGGEKIVIPHDHGIKHADFVILFTELIELLEK